MTTPLLRLQAFTGIYAAREALNWCCVWHTLKVTNGPSDEAFVAGLLPLYTAAAPGVECPGCPEPDGRMETPEICACEGTLRVPDPHALLKLGVRVGWRCWERAPGKDGHDVMPEAHDALQAATRWLKEPTEERFAAWKSALEAAEFLPWLPHYNVSPCNAESWSAHCPQAALPIIGREAFGRCAVEEVSEECDTHPCYGNGDLGGDCALRNCPGCHGTGRVPK